MSIPRRILLNYFTRPLKRCVSATATDFLLDVRVLRPVGLDETDRGRLAEWVVGRIGGEYDLKHAWMVARSLLPVPPSASLPPAPVGMAESATPFARLKNAAGMRWVLALAGMLVLAACHEIAQEATKPYAGKPDTRPYDGPPFKGDKAAFEKALAARAQGQNEYVRIGDAPKK